MGDRLRLYRCSVGLRKAGEQVERLGAAGGFVGVAFGVLSLRFASRGLAHPLGRPLFAARDISGEVLLDPPEGLHVEVGLSGLGQGIVDKGWQLRCRQLGEELFGRLHVLGWDKGDRVGRMAGALFGEEVGDLQGLAGDWRQLDERIETVTDEIETLAKSEDSCRRVMTVPGIGPIISSAMVAAIGSGVAFAKGRDFSAWLGLVPKQMSTGDRTILGRISKRGNGYLRMLFMQAARVILLRPANWPKHGFGVWLVRAAQRLHPNVLAAALANKLARIAWTVLVQERSYQARVTKAAA